MIIADCGCELNDLDGLCPTCQSCASCCECGDCDELYDADELGLDPEQDDRRRYHEEG
jgi:hypothetical protein